MDAGKLIESVGSEQNNSLMKKKRFIYYNSNLIFVFRHRLLKSSTIEGVSFNGSDKVTVKLWEDRPTKFEIKVIEI